MAAFNFVTVRDALYTQILASLTGTKVYKYPLGDQQVQKNETDDTYEWVEFTGMNLNRDIETYGLMEDVADFTVMIIVEAPWGGG